MSNPYTGTVASALRKAQLLLGAHQQAANEQPLMDAALLESAVTQLWRAYRAFLAEQGHQLQLGFAAGAEPDSAQALAALVSQRGKFSGDVTELVNLSEDPQSWLSRLSGAWAGLWQLSLSTPAGPAGAANVGGSGVETMIPVRQLDNPSARPLEAPLTADNLHQWHQALVELIQRQRAQSQEW
ncbi:hypothetical protein KUV22_02090 [Microbulbifer agarilyticus]|uniref:DUF6586 family protein n=1 Tax=Microbulbifer agarilyticus TaxID=260552 RepID=UPI001C937D1B|nr:DUF6586 family protein [Microbulbifer agarilyticus]MBY6189200.1 hypothetical protein [Microbulbifer agarilyticus]